MLSWTRLFCMLTSSCLDCYSCITEWKKSNTSCPLCRRPISTITDLKREIFINPNKLTLSSRPNVGKVALSLSSLLSCSHILPQSLCTLCGRRFSSDELMHAHQESYHKCYSCHGLFPNQDILRVRLSLARSLLLGALLLKFSGLRPTSKLFTQWNVDFALFRPLSWSASSRISSAITIFAISATMVRLRPFHRQFSLH